MFYLVKLQNTYYRLLQKSDEDGERDHQTTTFSAFMLAYKRLGSQLRNGNVWAVDTDRDDAGAEKKTHDVLRWKI